VSWISLAAFAATFDPAAGDRPDWVLPAAASLPADVLGLRGRLEDVLDTVTSWQRAEWQQDGVYVGPTALPGVYRDALLAARRLEVAVPPVIVCNVSGRSQGIHGTDARAFVALSAIWNEGAAEAERRFVLGRAVGHLAARQVTHATLFAMLVDGDGLRANARRLVGPVLEIALAPIGLATRLALARWHRAAELSADRAGLIVGEDLEAAATAMIRENLSIRPAVPIRDYLASIRAVERSPGRWAELLSVAPWTHKRIAALDLFQSSEVWARRTGEPIPDALPLDELNRRVTALLGVS